MSKGASGMSEAPAQPFWREFLEASLRETGASANGPEAERRPESLATAAAQLSAIERRYRALIERLPAALYIADADGRVRYVNARMERLLGFPAAAWMEDPGLWSRQLHPDDRADVEGRVEKLRLGEALVTRFRLTAADGRVVALREESTLIDLGYGSRLIVGTLVEDGKVLAAREPNGSQLGYDELTGLLNRHLLSEHLGVAVERARQTDRQLALLHLDLDDFKLVNESLGPPAADEVLRQVAQRLRDLTRPVDLVARPGGDEFCVLLADIDGDAEDVAEIVAGQISVALEHPFSVEGADFHVGASIGASLFPRDAGDEDALLKHADAAMHEAKQSGTGGFALYAGATSDALGRLMLTARLRKALNKREFMLHYQPIYDLVEERPVSVEALLRWRDEERGLVMPLEFVPIAEYTGLIEPIGEWIIASICEQARTWRKAGFEGTVSFNASLRQLQPERFVRVLESGLAATGLEASALTVELTESTAMRDPSCVEPVLHELRDLGVTIAIDDFGTGYSSLSRLQHMPVQILKIDRCFLDQVPEQPHTTRIVGATIDLAGALGMTAVAEGVETEEQRRFLIDRGCPSGQGFHLARPLAAEEATALIAPGSRALR